MPIDFHFTVIVTAETREQAEQVLRERIEHDEDYGFDYSIGSTYAAAGIQIELED